MDARTPLTGTSYLTQDEAQFVYNVEVLGMPLVAAANAASLPLHKMSARHVLQARELTRRELRGATQITKEDCVFGIQEAIGRAKILAEPATEIKGWEAIAKLLGYDAPQQIDINVRETVTVIQDRVKTLSTEDLVRMAGAEDIIDGDFKLLERPRE